VDKEWNISDTSSLSPCKVRKGRVPDLPKKLEFGGRKKVKGMSEKSHLKRGKE